MYTERVLIILAFEVLEAFDNYRLQKIPRNVLCFVREIGMWMEPYIASKRIIRLILDMSDVIEDTIFTALPSSWSARGTREYEKCPGNTVAGWIGCVTASGHGTRV